MIIRIQHFITLGVALLALSACNLSPSNIDSSADIDAITETNRRVREAFLQQDMETILLYHHPQVEKSLDWGPIQKGHSGMRSALDATFENYVIELLDAGKRESLEVLGDNAVMIRKFKVKGSPKKTELNAFVFEGRTMIVYQRDASSPTGWKTIREMIMPKPN